MSIECSLPSQTSQDRIPQGKENTTLDEMETQMFCVSVQLGGCNSSLSSVAWLLLCCTIQKNYPKKQQFPSTFFFLLYFQDSLAYFHFPVSSMNTCNLIHTPSVAYSGLCFVLLLWFLMYVHMHTHKPYSCSSALPLFNFITRLMKSHFQVLFKT